MLERYKGCLLGAVLGDAVGMPSETTVSRFINVTLGFKKAYKGHPNHELQTGSYTDDSQLILIASRLLANGEWSLENYAKELLVTYDLNKFRYPDGTLFAACRRMKKSGDLTGSGVHSDSAGAIALAVPFAIAFKDRKEMAKNLLEAVSITHTHPAATSATISFALMLNVLIETGSVLKAYETLINAAENMDPDLAMKISNAFRLDRTGAAIEDATISIGNSSSVYQTVPLVMFLCKRYENPGDLLAYAAAAGGNADTITMLCGAFSGARSGISALPQDLLAKLERRSEFETLAEKLSGYKNEEVADEELFEDEVEKAEEETAEVEE